MIDGRQRLDWYMKARVSTAPEPISWWLSAQVMLMRPDGEPLKPLLRLETILTEQATASGDGYSIRSREVGYYADLASGAPLKTWTNPLSGETLTPPPYDDGARTTRLDRAEFDEGWGDGRAAYDLGDLVSISDNHLAAEADTRGVSRLLEYWSPRIQLADPARAAASAEVTIQYVIGRFYPWLRMPPTDGFLYARIYGTKAAAGDAPDPVKAATIAALFPDMTLA